MRKVVVRMIVFASTTGILLSILVLVATGMGWQIGTVVSSSMEPSLSVGEAALCRPMDTSSIRPGDIIAYESPDDPEATVTHRVTRIVSTQEGLRFETMGDANQSPDYPLVPSENVKGKIVFAVPYLGYVISFFRTPPGIAMMIVIPLLVLIATRTGTLRRLLSGSERESPAVTGEPA